MKAKAQNEHEDGLLEYLEDIIGTTKYKQPIEDASKEIEELNDQRGEKMNRLNVVEHEMTPGEDVEDDAALEKAVVASVDGYAHPTSTVPMGGVDDPCAVVDADGKVRGVDGLHVVDASIMPDIPSVATNVTTIMIAEAISRRL